VQNIGAYGVEAKDIIERVEYLDLETLEMKSIPQVECEFGYRESIFKGALAGKVIITAVVYRLRTTATPRLDYGTLRPEVEKTGDFSPEGIRRAIMTIRNSKLPDPKKIGNAGSFFKNPILPREQVERLKSEYPSMPIYEVAGAPDRLKIATGWMIDTLGWKGKSMGKAGVHTHQALVLVNLGGATGKGFWHLPSASARRLMRNSGLKSTPR
jgi:UDP-N-acetylmuramate dehydrogenase